MSDKTSLGDRMKAYEKGQTPPRFMAGVPVCARIDGKNFSKFTKGLARPYDERFSELMVRVTTWLVQETNAKIGYTQSDEISLVWFADNEKQQIFMDGKRDKMVSLLAAMATGQFNKQLKQSLPEKAHKTPVFDARVWQVPSKTEAANYLLWRERDATKNSIAMAAQEHYSHKALHKKNGSQMQDMLHAAGINWNDYPAFFKRGTYVQRRKRLRKFYPSELAKLPPKHAAHTNPDLQIERTSVVRLQLPPCTQVPDFEAIIFEGSNDFIQSDD